MRRTNYFFTFSKIYCQALGKFKEKNLETQKLILEIEKNCNFQYYFLEVILLIYIWKLYERWLMNWTLKKTEIDTTVAGVVTYSRYCASSNCPAESIHLNASGEYDVFCCSTNLCNKAVLVKSTSTALVSTNAAICAMPLGFSKLLLVVFASFGLSFILKI